MTCSSHEDSTSPETDSFAPASGPDWAPFTPCSDLAQSQHLATGYNAGIATAAASNSTDLAATAADSVFGYKTASYGLASALG